MVTEKSLFVLWTIVGLPKFTTALQPVFLYQNLITVFIMVSENNRPLAHKITLLTRPICFHVDVSLQVDDSRGSQSS